MPGHPWTEIQRAKFRASRTGHVVTEATRSKLSSSVANHGHRSGGKSSREYTTWHKMKERCLNPNHVAYKRYGGRGITVCDEWRYSFETFLEDMGLRPENTSIDRINNELGYYKANCRWATPTEQQHNRGDNVH